MTIILIQAINVFAQVMFWLILARAITSWFRPGTYNRAYLEIQRFLVGTTEWILGPIRNAMPNMAIDFSPFVAIILIQLLRNLVVQLLWRLSF